MEGPISGVGGGTAVIGGARYGRGEGGGGGDRILKGSSDVLTDLTRKRRRRVISQNPADDGEHSGPSAVARSDGM